MGNGNAAKINEAVKANTQAARSVRGGTSRTPQEAMEGLQKLAGNPQAMGMLKQIFGGGGADPKQGAGPVQASGASGPDILYVAIANCVNGIVMHSERTAIELAEAKKKLEIQDQELAGFRKMQEAEALKAQARNEAKRTASKVLEQALKIAADQGGNKALSDAIVALAQESGITLTPEHLDSLGGTKKED